MTKEQKIKASNFYSDFFFKYYTKGYFSPIAQNKFGAYCFNFEIDKTYEECIEKMKTEILQNNFELIQSDINPRKFLAIYNG
jgi:hypothetical protein